MPGSRRRNDLKLQDIVRAPWQLGAILAVICAAIGFAIPAFFASSDNPLLQIALPARYLMFVMAVIFALGAVGALVRQIGNGLLLKKGKDIDSIRALTWQEFERLIEEAFRRDGFIVAPTVEGADGGVDVVLRKGSNKFYVQCKHWKRWKVGVDKVRELAGVVAIGGAQGGYLVTSGSYTADASKFARQANIILIDGESLIGLIGKAETANTSELAVENHVPSNVPLCPSCRTTMVLRTARRGKNAGEEFWGCSNFPSCKKTQLVS